jgi:hypothetical protein
VHINNPFASIVAELAQGNDLLVLLKVHIRNRAFPHNFEFILVAAMAAWEIEHCA